MAVPRREGSAADRRVARREERIGGKDGCGEGGGRCGGIGIL